MANKISVIIDVAVDKANASLKGFRQSIAQAEGASGKFKAGFASVSKAVQDNAATLAASAGTALVAFGVKSVQAFQETALAAGKFSDATGIAVEDASRFIEVAGDLGIEAGALQGAIQKMNKAIADGKPVFADYGVEIVRTSSGVVDANATFIQAVTTIGKIQDPTKRAQAAQQAFGKSYAEVSELMTMSADELADALGNVSEAKTIDERELKRAREFRESMDNLRDTLEDVSIAAGEDLVPVLTALADALVWLRNVKLDEDSMLGQLIDVAETSINPLSDVIDKVKELADFFGIGGEAAEDFGGRAEYYASRIKAAAAETAQATRIEEEANDAREEANKKMQEARDRFREATAAAEAYRKKIEEMYGVERDAIERQRDYAESVKDLGAALDDANASLDDQMDAAIGASEAYATLNGASLNTAAGTQRQIDSLYSLALSLDPNSPLRKALLGYIEELQKIPAEVNTRLRLNISSGSVTTRDGDIIGQRVGLRARGGPVRAGQPYLVGEEGPELMVPDQSGTVMNTDQTRAALGPTGGVGMSGSAPVTVNIYPRALPTDRELIDLINGVRRRNGSVI